MKRNLLIAPLLAGSTLLTGCLVVDIGRKSPPPPVAPAPQVVIVPATPADSATFAEIDAAARLSFDTAKVDSLSKIAARQNLSPAAQVHLVDAVFHNLSFENSKVSLLQLLVQNPAFCNAAKHSIVARLQQFSFDSNKSVLLAAIDQRGELKN